MQFGTVMILLIQMALLVSPNVLDKYFFPWLKKIGDLAKHYNKPLIYHTDGILYDVMDRIIQMRG